METVSSIDVDATQPAEDGFVASWYYSVIQRVPWAKEVFPAPNLNQDMALQVVRYGQASAVNREWRLVTQLEASKESDGALVVGNFEFQTTHGAFELHVGPSRESLNNQLSIVLDQKVGENSRTVLCQITHHSDPSRNVRYSVTSPTQDTYSGAESLLLRIEIDGQVLEDAVVLSSPNEPPIIERLRELVGRRTPIAYPLSALQPALMQEVWRRDLAIETMGREQSGIGTVIALPSGWRCILATVVAGALLGFVAALIVRIACWEGAAR